MHLPCAVYNRLITAMGRPDMGIANPDYATDAKRCEREDEINKASLTKYRKLLHPG